MSARRMTSDGGYRLRHIHPTARFPSEGATTTVLGRPYGFTELPISGLPGGEDLVEGGWTGRLGDAGEFTLSFPNAAGSKGLWRERFDPDRSLEFVEVYGPDEELEFVGSIARMEIDRGTVTISGPDAWALLRRAYERDRTWTAAPQEVLNAYTRVPVPVLVDAFDGSALSGSWTVSSTNPAVVANGTVRIGGGSSASITRSVSIASDSWRASVTFDRFDSGGNPSAGLTISVRNSALADLADLRYGENYRLGGSGLPNVLRNVVTPVGEAGRCTLTIERRGQWVAGYVNGELVGFRRTSGLSNDTPASVQVSGSGTSPIAVYVDEVTVVELQPFLARGSDVGEYVLPGDYPPGGLRGRYFNNGDLQGYLSALRLARIMAPDREHYAERLDPVIDTSGGLSLPVQPGSDGDYFSVRWFGAVYLRGDLADVTFEANHADGVRLWVGKTRFEDAIIDDWTSAGGRLTTGTWDASDHGSAAGWYPIVLEHYHDTTAYGLQLKFTPAGSGTYVDPGGTTITRGTKIIVPATSLSPLGCFDGRMQGQPHFDIIQQVAAQFGYQMRCEPMSLESGEFPGRLVPRDRVGRDTDIELVVEEDENGDPILAPGVTIDSSDQTLLLIGSGAGIADGRGSQVTAEIADLENLPDALFALEGVVDAGDIGQPALLEARLNAELALRSLPWEEVRGTPLAQDRLADTWPLSGALSAMRWEAGDGVKLILPHISVEDTDTRQLLQVTRAFNGLGRTGTQVAFRQRPRSAARSVRGLVRASLVSRRSYQGTTATLAGNRVSTSAGAGAFTGYSILDLYPGDRVVRAYVRIPTNTAAQALGVEVNGTDHTSDLGGPWTTVPVEIDLLGYATQAGTSDARLFVRLQNTGGSTTVVEFSLIVEVLR